ncbi:efflux RND transporter permease subunit, partial [Rothia aeria]|nr:efflux RND transporter permease subunit [Rothia aeria]
MPKTDRGQFLIQIELPKDQSLEQTNQKVIEVERYIQNKKEIVDMITTVGQMSTGFGASQATAY